MKKILLIALFAGLFGFTFAQDSLNLNTEEMLNDCINVQKQPEALCKLGQSMAQGLMGIFGGMFGGTGGLNLGSGLLDSFKEFKLEGLTAIKGNKEEMKGNRKEFREDFGFAFEYLKKPISTGDKATVKLIILEKNRAVLDLNKQMKSQFKSGLAVDVTGAAAQFGTIFSTFKEKILPYIDPAKLDKFVAFIQSKIDMHAKNFGIRSENFQIKKDIKSAKEELKEKKQEIKAVVKQTKLDEKLQKLTSEQLKNVLQKVDNQIGRISILSRTLTVKEKKQLEQLVKLRDAIVAKIGN